MRSLLWILPVIAERRAAFAGTIASNLLHQVGTLALAAFSALFLGLALFSPGFADEWRTLSAVIAALIVVVAVCAWWESYISHDLAYALLAALRSRAFGELARSVPTRSTGRSSADETATVMGDVETLEWLFAHTVAQMLTSAVVLAIGGVVSALISPLLIGVWLTAALLLAALPWIMSRWGIHQGARVRGAGVALHSLLVETVQGAGDLAAAGELRRRLARVDATDRELSRWQLRSGSRAGFEGALSELIVSAAGVFAVIMMAGAVNAGEVSPQYVAVAMVVAIGTLAPAAQIAGLLKNLGGLIASTGRLREIFTAPDAAPRPAEPAIELDPTNVDALEFDAVTFGYDPADPVLHDVSFRIERGEIVALVGASGAGKSTVAALALRMWDPDAGRVVVGGASANGVSDGSLRRSVTAVPQETQLLRGTVTTNLMLARPDASIEQLHRAADAAHLRDPRSGFATGLDTQVGERGAGLSGGQRARVSFARAMLTGAPFIVLDEASAHLDLRSERDLADVLRAHPDRGALVIAHRSQAIAACDRVIVMEQGRITEEGTPTNLLADDTSALSTLLRREAVADDTEEGR